MVDRGTTTTKGQAMFDTILTMLRGAAPPTPLPAADRLHLTGALLVRVARADDQWHLAEVQALDRLLGTLAQVGPLQAARLRAACERLEITLPPTADLGPLLAAHLSAPDRAALLAGLETVALADGVDHPQERAVIARVAALIG